MRGNSAATKSTSCDSEHPTTIRFARVLLMRPKADDMQAFELNVSPVLRVAVCLCNLLDGAGVVQKTNWYVDMYCTRPHPGRRASRLQRRTNQLVSKKR